AVLQNLTLSGNVSVSNTPSSISGTINNLGTIQLPFFLNIAGNTSLSGGGSLLMTSPLAALTSMTVPGRRLTSNNAISGQGAIGQTLIKFTNAGSLTATGGTLIISPYAAPDGFISTGSLRADAGTLLFSSPSTYLISGPFLAANASSIIF